jgi:signal transduction histidine kinase
MIKELESFTHTVAHDLKNPLGLVLAYANLLQQDIGVMPEETLREYATKMFNGGVKMRTIIEELLLLAQTRYGEVQPVPIDMQPLVEAARWRLLTVNSEAQPEVRLPHFWPAALGYAPWIEEVWFNYLSNALKYGGQPPQIELGADIRPDAQIRFWVRDNGPGLTRDQIGKLFAPFTQLGQVSSRGHGLGLSIVRHIVEKLGGEVGVESVPGQGCLFYFTLPPVRVTDQEQAGV